MKSAGNLTDRITIQSPNGIGRDEYGMETGETWANVATVWADVDDLSTKDTIADRASQGTLQARAVVRYSSVTKNINTKMRVLFEGKYYRIDGDPKRDTKNRRTYLTINLAEALPEWQS